MVRKSDKLDQGKNRFGALYRGLLAPLLVESPRRAVKFAAFEAFSQFYRKLGIGENQRFISVISGASGGCVEGALVVAFELVKIRLQDKNNVFSSLPLVLLW